MALSIVGVCWLVAPLAAAEEMDLALSRLRLPPGRGGCPADGPVCPNNEAFERLVSDLAVGLAPPVGGGAASLGSRGFALAVSAAFTPVDGTHWRDGTEGADAAGGARNLSPDGVLVWNRVEIRKGLPFGLEAGGALGSGINSSLWVFSGQLRAVLFEGYRTGLGALPDIALRGVVQSLFGSPQLSLRTLAFDVTLSKPYVIAGRHRLTPLLAMQALFVHAASAPIDLTPDVSSWDTCAAAPGDELMCRDPAGELERRSTARFEAFDQTRIRLFVGVEEQYGPLLSSFTLGYDLALPPLHAETLDDDVDGGLSRALTLHFSVGLRY